MSDDDDGHDDREWLEADGAGGFASGPATGPRTRRYHALLLTAHPRTGQRFVLVNGAEVVATTAAGPVPITVERYADGTLAGGAPGPPAAAQGFAAAPWPRWTFALPDGTRIVAEVLVGRGGPAVLAWRLDAGSGPVTLTVRLFFSGRDYHALHHENPQFRFAAAALAPDRQLLTPYEGVPGIVVAAGPEAAFTPAPCWYRDFFYREEAARGFDALEDLAAPGVHVLRLDRASPRAALVLTAAPDGVTPAHALPALAWADAVRAEEERRRAAFATPLALAADAYLVSTPAGPTIIAGYPWFTDWGRDTFIALRGLLLATDRHDVARAVLRRWASAVHAGLLPNRFAELGRRPEYNAVDAALWFVVVVGELLDGVATDTETRATLTAAVTAILDGHLAVNGHHHGIRVDGDGLLAAGAPGVQLTWMDAKLDHADGPEVVTPRTGKPVEIQALWLNALATGLALVGAAAPPRWAEVLERGQRRFRAGFWNAEAQCLYDVIDVDHVPGTRDARVRPNQIFAVGGLPRALLEPAAARAVVDAVESALVVPGGVRTLARDDPAYCGRYRGGPVARDRSYHQGTAWPWLLGPFVEAWVRVRGGGPAPKAEARRRFLAPLAVHLDAAGVGHVSELVDGDPPHRPRGCPFQAWSLGEFLRLDKIVLRP